MVMAGIAATSGLRSLTPKGEAFATSRLRNIRYGLRIPPEPGRTVVGNGRQPTLAVQVRDCGRRGRAGLRCQIGPLPSEASNLMHGVRGVVPGDFAWGPLHRATCTMPLGANPVTPPGRAATSGLRLATPSGEPSATSRLRHEPGTVASDVEMLTKQIQRRAGSTTPGTVG